MVCRTCKADLFEHIGITDIRYFKFFAEYLEKLKRAMV